MNYRKPTIKALFPPKAMASIRYATNAKMLMVENPGEVPIDEWMKIYADTSEFARITPIHDIAYTHFQTQLTGIRKAITDLYLSTTDEPKDLALRLLVRKGREKYLIEVCETYELPHLLIQPDGISNEFLINLESLDLDSPNVQEGYEFVHDYVKGPKTRSDFMSSSEGQIQLVYSKLYFK